MGRYTPSTNRQLSPLLLLGRHAADTSLWSAIVTMLATLDFNLAKDADGNDIKFKATFTQELSLYVQIVSNLSFRSSFFFAKRFQAPETLPLSAHPSSARRQRDA